MADYEAFLAAKAHRAEAVGFEVDGRSLPRALKPFQRAVVNWALRQGRAAMFEGTGLGKTLQELSWARAVHQRTGKPVLVFTPLAVGQRRHRKWRSRNG